MVTKESAINIAKSFVDDCKSNGLKFDRVMIFGSVATNHLHEWSDIDLLLVSEQFGDNVFDNLKLYSKVNIKYPIIETHPYPTALFRKGSAFINEVIKNAIEID